MFINLHFQQQMLSSEGLLDSELLYTPTNNILVTYGALQVLYCIILYCIHALLAHS